MSEPTLSHPARVAVVTGATRGIGRAVALRLAADGYDLALVGRNQERLASVAAEVQGAHREALRIATDVRDVDAIAPAVDRIERELGSIRVLVNNAGVPLVAPPLEITESEWDAVSDTNLKAAFFWSQATARVMIGRENASIVNVSSAAGTRPYPGRTAYATSKAGLMMLTRMLALELAPNGIRVNAVAPTFVEVGMSKLTLSDPAVLEATIRQVPLGRLATAADVTSAISYLVSGEASFITGAVLPVDGGLALSI